MKSRCFPLILLISLASSACGTVQVEKTLLMKLTPEQSGTISTKGIEKVFTFSSDGAHFLYMSPGQAIIDGVESEKYDSVYGARFSPDGKHTAYVGKLNGKYCAVIDGRRGPEFDEIKCYIQSPESPETILYTPDSQHYGYLARNGKSWFAVVDGQPQPAPDVEFNMAGPLALTADGKHTAFLGQQGMKRMVVVDGRAQPGPETNYFKVEQLVLSPDGKRWAYKAQQTNRNWLVVVDGVAGPEYDEISAGWPAFTPDGKHLAYVAHLDKKWVLVTDGQPGPEYRIIADVVFSRDGSKTIYTVLQGEDMNLVLNGQAILRSWDWQFSADEKHYAHRADKGGEASVVWDGRPGPGFDDVASPVFSPDGTRLAYKATKGKKGCVVVDDQAGPGYDEVTDPSFSADGKHIVYAANKKGKWTVVIDGKPGLQYDSVGRTFFDEGKIVWLPTAPRLSSDGSRMACGVKQDKKTCVSVEGQLGLEVDEIWSYPTFSLDGTHVAYCASTAKDGAFVVLDGQAGPGFSSIRPPYDIQYAPDGSVEYLGLTSNTSAEGQSIYRVKLTPVQ